MSYAATMCHNLSLNPDASPAAFTRLAIEYKDGRETDRVNVFAGESDWDEPTDQVHRAVNVGRTTYEEVTIFFLDRPDAIPQPIAE